MATMTMTIPDAMLPRVVAAFAATHGYRATLPNGDPNPQTPAQFARAQVANFIKHTVTNYESELAKSSNDIEVVPT